MGKFRLKPRRKRVGFFQIDSTYFEVWHNPRTFSFEIFKDELYNPESKLAMVLNLSYEEAENLMAIFNTASVI